MTARKPKDGDRLRVEVPAELTGAAALEAAIVALAQKAADNGGATGLDAGLVDVAKNGTASYEATFIGPPEPEQPEETQTA